MAEAEIAHALPDGDEEAQGDCFEVWPENMPALEIFLSLRNQWHVLSGMAGSAALGLRYESLRMALWARRVPVGGRRQLFDDIQVMESAALEVMNRRQDGC